MTIRKLAAKYGVNKSTIGERSKAEGWKESRTAAADRARTKAVQKTADAAASNATKLERARGLIIDRLINAIQRMPEDAGSRTRQMLKDANGRSITRDYDLLALISVYEKLTRASNGVESEDDPVMAMLKRWDDASGI